MSKPITDALAGRTVPVLVPQLLARIHALNLDYLELCSAERRLGNAGAQLQHLPPKVQLPLGQLGGRARGSMSSTPYSLYSLCFEDLRFWQSVCVGADEPIETRYAANTCSWLQASFCEVALIEARQEASNNPLAARVLYAMSDRVCTLLCATPLWQIKRIANTYPGLLQPRWPRNPAFWPDLIRFAEAADSPRLMTTKLLGTQLIAGELSAGAEGSSSTPFNHTRRSIGGRAHSLRSLGALP